MNADSALRALVAKWRVYDGYLSAARSACADELESILAAPQTAPADMVLVPREPTAAMLKVAAHEGGGCTLGQADGEYYPSFDDPMTRRVWAAMLAAAPAAQVARVTESMVAALEKTGDELIGRMERHQERMARVTDKLAAAPAVVVDEALYTAEEVAEAMEVLRGRNGSSAITDDALAEMERVLLAAAPAAQVTIEGPAVPISVGRQEKQVTHPSLPTFYQTRLNFGSADNAGNTVAFVFGNNSTDAEEQMAFAEKLVSAYNRDYTAPAVVVDEAMVDAEPAPILVRATVVVAAEQFATIAEDFLRRAEPYLTAIDEGADAGDDEPSKTFRSALRALAAALSQGKANG